MVCKRLKAILPRVGVLLFVGIVMMGAGATNFSLAQTGAASSTAAALNDQGSFAISFGGHPLGTEKFKIRSDAY